MVMLALACQKLYGYAIQCGAASVTYAPQIEQNSLQDKKTAEEETAP